MSRTAVERLQSTHPLPTIARDATEVIGMHGGPPRDKCGIAAPIARCPQDGFFHKIVETGLPIWHHADYLEGMAERNDLALVAGPLPLPVSTPKILLVDVEFIEHTGCELPVELGGAQCTWTTLKNVTIRTHATCVPQREAEEWLDSCARRLMQKFDEEVRSTRTIDRQELRDLADLGITAATASDLRFDLWLRFCSMLDPDKVRRQFDVLIVGEFNCSWKSFQGQVTGIVDKIRSSESV